MYSPPPAVALDIAFTRGNYTFRPASAVDFDFATDGGASVEYSPVPGVVASFGAPWNPQPADKGSTIAALFEQAEQLGILRGINSDSASALIEPLVCLPHANASERGATVASVWDSSIQSRERALSITSNNAPQKDIGARRVKWETASQQIDVYSSSPFLVNTPWKDRALTEGYFSSALYAPLWLKIENKPEPFYAVKKGEANLEFFDRKNIRRPGVYEIGSVWENNPIQPKDTRFNSPHSNADKKDIELFDTPWGAGTPVDITRAVVAESYVGPIGDVVNPGDDSTFIIPTLRFYVVTNSAQIVRVSDGVDVPAASVSLSINADSYSWAMTATLAGRDAEALLEGTDAEPVEVDVMINGESWRVVIDAWRSSESWRNNSVSVTGRSRAAYLAAPYADLRDYAETSQLLAQQLAAQELPPGWALDWSVADWLVDAGAWKYSGLSPIDAISRIATAGGGYVQADKSLDTIHVKPLYNAAPWDWLAEAPNFIIPSDVIVQRESTKKPGQGVNGVFVHGGESGGILAKVLRTGTAGDVLAPTIVDPLITDLTPARWRGVAAIAARRRQSTEIHELPLSASLGGLIEPGALIVSGKDVSGSFVDLWRGMVRGVTVTAGAARASNGGTSLRVRQRIEVERHFNED
jgi:hypothetical protein